MKDVRYFPNFFYSITEDPFRMGLKHAPNSDLPKRWRVHFKTRLRKEFDGKMWEKDFYSMESIKDPVEPYHLLEVVTRFMDEAYSLLHLEKGDPIDNRWSPSDLRVFNDKGEEIDVTEEMRLTNLFRFGQAANNL